MTDVTDAVFLVTVTSVFLVELAFTKSLDPLVGLLEAVVVTALETGSGVHVLVFVVLLDLCE